MAFQISLERVPIVVVHVEIFSLTAEDKLYDAEIVNLHLELVMDFQDQSSFPATAYNTIEGFPWKDTHPHLYSC